MIEKTKITNVKNIFNLTNDFDIEILEHNSPYIPEPINYYFDSETTLAILQGFKHNLKILIHGMHGSGKSSHIEQIAARLNWPTFRINLDGYITRSDLIGRDTIVIKDGMQITEFKEGVLPWALRQPMALILDEYDAGRPELMFILQRLLENNGKFTLADNNEVIIPHPQFRLFATANTLGNGDNLGLYSGTQLINQAQLDRWQMVVNLNYLEPEAELDIIISQAPFMKNDLVLTKQMVQMANLTRNGFKLANISCLMSPRTLINWANNYHYVNDLELAFKLSFLNKCNDTEKPLIVEYYQRVFNHQLSI